MTENTEKDVVAQEQDASSPAPDGPGAEQPTVKVVNKRVVGDDPTEGAWAEPPGSADTPDLAHELAEARAQSAQHLDDLLRLKAEFENFRKRMVKEQTQMVERAASGLVERLLPVLDNFELALIAADRTKDYEAMVRGVELVYSELIEVLRREGLEPIKAVEAPFDPELHEAVMQAEGDGEQLVVVDEMRRGYTLSGRVIRPAMVKVGKR